MAMSNVEIMRSARGALKGSWGIPIAVVVIFVLIFIVCGAIPVVGWIADILLTGPLLVGLWVVYLNLIRGKPVATGQLFEGFQSFGNSLAAYILVIVFVLLWTLLLIVPGIIAGYSYAMTFQIIADNPGIDGPTAIRRSKEMMQGNKMKLFCMECRFIGWFLLCLVTIGIALIWVAPYWLASHARFYEEMTSAKTATAA